MGLGKILAPELWTTQSLCDRLAEPLDMESMKKFRRELLDETGDKIDYTNVTGGYLGLRNLKKGLSDYVFFGSEILDGGTRIYIGDVLSVGAKVIISSSYDKHLVEELNETDVTENYGSAIECLENALDGLNTGRDCSSWEASREDELTEKMRYNRALISGKLIYCDGVGECLELIRDVFARHWMERVE